MADQKALQAKLKKQQEQHMNLQQKLQDVSRQQASVCSDAERQLEADLTTLQVCQQSTSKCIAEAIKQHQGADSAFELRRQSIRDNAEMQGSMNNEVMVEVVRSLGQCKGVITETMNLVDDLKHSTSNMGEPSQELDQSFATQG
eukprot:TRINITY_DN2269_c0_g1_i9.p2 TRINITY_DN2269_c0_g1~~TRINITY_DN2269_c0_g1_i9.p2  ORF type:complete len:144 (-),score=51.46 TRINITY_DN2269_c0_g1_i9:223-654(-)